MNLDQRIKRARNLTPTEQQLAQTVRALGVRLNSMSIQELALASNASIASVHRFCKKLGIEGFKELKVEVARMVAKQPEDEAVDINFPFVPNDQAETIAARMELLYETTLRETRETLDMSELERAARLVNDARQVNIFTLSHNLYPAQMFCDRLLSSGKSTTCHSEFERQIRSALASGPEDVAIAISYSGLAPNLQSLIPILTDRKVPVILIGSAHASLKYPGLSCFLEVSDSESLSNRITQFASHASVQYVLDVLYGTYFALDYDRRLEFLEQSLPHTLLPGTITPP